MAKKKVKTEAIVITPPEGIESQNEFTEGETQPRCGFSHIRYIMIQEVKGKGSKTFTYPVKEVAAPLRHANKYLLGNQRVVVPGMDQADGLQYKYSYVGDDIQIHVFWATKKPKSCDKN